MNTPEKEPSSQVPPLHCSLTVENLTSLGTVHKSVTYKGIKLILGRNEFRDIIVRMDGAKHSLQFPVRDFQLHKRFMKEGKATISQKNVNLNLMIANAPPNQLAIFMKTLASKHTLLGPKQGVINARQRLLSTVPKSFEEISPLTLKEYETVRSNNGRMPLKERNGNVPGASPVSSKRKMDKEVQLPKDLPSLKRQAPSLRNQLVLTTEQKKVLQIVQSGHNVFFTGSAGTGKSLLLKLIVGALSPDVTFVTASTGVAACQIGGTTLHAFAGIGSGHASLEQCVQLASRKVVAQQWRKCKHLIVDEISMVDGVFFKVQSENEKPQIGPGSSQDVAGYQKGEGETKEDSQCLMSMLMLLALPHTQKLEAVGRAIRGNNKPFGGIQLILCGDFLQLPPVTKPGEKRVFCFQTSAWNRCINISMELTEVRRQDDQEFINILQSIRLGRCTEDMVDCLKSTESNEVEKDGIKATRLCTHREDVDHINQEHLNKLTGNAKVFQAIDSDPHLSKNLDSQTPVVTKLVLKVGTQVMLMKNLDVGKGLVNGARGVVTGFKQGNEGYPIVRFLCGVTADVKHEKWTVRGTGGIYLSRRQLPLKLAWAFSIHKSQGMTLDCAEMSLSRVFEAGQAYVALSRARNLKGLRVLDFNPTCVRAHPDVLKFYEDLRKIYDLEQQSIESYL
ncbi:ATP-dependent DNA helicase PIF1-like 1 [Homarus americanus]|uniref:ATP-dependent DNA helicase PIF1 n=1 Tax=Homarus americanus TaxID=6706 RepID=A0A8J5JU66_HOMAM|nr:ATP-dependent DNA helicase PIF1-like 1 [Homarus americanus]